MAYSHRDIMRSSIPPWKFCHLTKYFSIQDLFCFLYKIFFLENFFPIQDLTKFREFRPTSIRPPDTCATCPARPPTLPDLFPTLPQLWLFPIWLAFWEKISTVCIFFSHRLLTFFPPSVNFFSKSLHFSTHPDRVCTRRQHVPHTPQWSRFDAFVLVRPSANFRSKTRIYTMKTHDWGTKRDAKKYTLPWVPGWSPSSVLTRPIAT